MVEFNGYICGTAEKYFWKRSRVLVQKIVIASILIFLPITAIFTIITDDFLILLMYFMILIFIVTLTYIPKSRKEKMSLTPKKIFTDDEYIVCVADKYVEYRLIREAKMLRDFEDFYEIVFPFGKKSEKFICQKSLLSKGTLDEFESLFEGKIKRNTGDGSVCLDEK